MICGCLQPPARAARRRRRPTRCRTLLPSLIFDTFLRYCFLSMIWLSTRGGAGPAGSQIGTATCVSSLSSTWHPAERVFQRQWRGVEVVQGHGFNMDRVLIRRSQRDHQLLL